MTPQELDQIQQHVHHLDEQYWNGDDATITAALNELADFVESIRAAWMNGATT